MDPSAVAKSFGTGVGNILGGIAVVIGLGSILGQLLAESGGAERIATALVGSFGRRGMALAFILAGFLIGLPVFFSVGLMLLIPIAETSAQRSGVRLSRFGLPLVAALSVSHGLIPPHPGPMAALATLHADPGKTILFGLLIGLPTALVGGLAFSWVNCGDDSEDALPQLPARSAPPNGAPGLLVALVTVLLPVGLMILGACAQFMLPEPAARPQGLSVAPDPWTVELRRWLLFVGDPVVAMLIAVLLSSYTLGFA